MEPLCSVPVCVQPWPNCKPTRCWLCPLFAGGISKSKRTNPHSRRFFLNPTFNSSLLLVDARDSRPDTIEKCFSFPSIRRDILFCSAMNTSNSLSPSDLSATNRVPQPRTVVLNRLKPILRDIQTAFVLVMEGMRHLSDALDLKVSACATLRVMLDPSWENECSSKNEHLTNILRLS